MLEQRMQLFKDPWSQRRGLPEAVTGKGELEI